MRHVSIQRALRVRGRHGPPGSAALCPGSWSRGGSYAWMWVSTMTFTTSVDSSLVHPFDRRGCARGDVATAIERRGPPGWRYNWWYAASRTVISNGSL